MNITTLDAVFLLILLICAIHGAFRGFIEELFSKLAVILGIICGLVFSKLLVPSLPKLKYAAFLTNILAFVIVFTVVYLAVRIIQKIIGIAFQGDIMKGLDKSLGFFLGIGEGVIIVCLILFLLHSQPWFDITGVVQGSVFDRIFAPLIINTSHEFIKEQHV